MASPLPLVCRQGPEPLRLAPAPRRRPVPRRHFPMLMRGLAVVGALSLPVAAAALADLAHPAPAASPR